ncbi:signal peptidase I [Clostridium sp. SHJSY1]|uniref:signal peptidase I n=1 Tax=Clostridium sp. SHJSY1 TaxID=2942483 RepID=UPI00287B8747|nr:signal peptidase I [Clostridium sp. SHJSY1]
MNKSSEEIFLQDIQKKYEINIFKKKNFILKLIILIIFVVCMVLLLKKYLICMVYIPSSSMVPTLNVGDHLLVTRVCNLKNLKRGDIIVFDSIELNNVLIKRLIGLPGDDVKIVKGKISINGQDVNERYVENYDDFNGEFYVPEGKYFFLGDNRTDSFDSRLWNNSYIDGKDIKAKAQIKIYPFKDLGTIK